jgi:hypothetical protein
MSKRQYGRIGYEYTHNLLKKHRGKAREYQCTDCENQAAHWSLSAYAEEILIESVGREAGRSYSHNLSDYEPRCRKCHYAYDKKHDLMRGPDGNRSGNNAWAMGTRTATKDCSYEGCPNPHRARGYCMRHYRIEERKNNGIWPTTG